MTRIFCLAALLAAGVVATAKEPCNFRKSAAYVKLSIEDRQRLEQVHRDLVLLWGALDMYADHHDGDLPSTLDELVPSCLAELPTDPFATEQAAKAELTHGYVSSKGGVGYRLKPGAPGNRAWVISSVGLPKFSISGGTRKRWLISLQGNLDFGDQPDDYQMRDGRRVRRPARGTRKTGPEFVAFFPNLWLRWLPSCGKCRQDYRLCFQGPMFVG